MKNFVLALGLILLAPLAVSRGAEPISARPNFIIILIDDMGYGDVGAYGSTLNRTPNIDRMAAEGLKLTSFYCAPVCTPSRAQLLTGCYAKRVSLPDVIGPAAKIGISASEHAIAQLLKEQGYATMAVGKWHVGDQPEFLPTRHGFDHYLGLPYSNDMGGEWDGSPDDPSGRRLPPLPLVRDEKVIETLKGKDQEKLVQLYTDESVKFISEHKNGPFFLYLPHTAVHVPIHPSKSFQGKSNNGRYGDWVEEVDASTGRIFQTLRDLKLDQNTLVIFTSDNGPWLVKGADAGTAGPLRGGKGGTYEGGMREPTIAWWPGHVHAGMKSDAVAGEIDLLPTIVKLAGGTVPADRKIDGADLAPLLFGKSDQSPRECHYYFNSNRLEAVRSGPWKLAIAPQREMNGKDKPLQPALRQAPFVPVLYNLETDIGETKDVAADHPDIVKHLEQFVDEMNQDLGTTGKGPGVRAPGQVANPKPLLLKKDDGQ